MNGFHTDVVPTSTDARHTAELNMKDPGLLIFSSDVM